MVIKTPVQFDGVRAIFSADPKAFSVATCDSEVGEHIALCINSYEPMREALAMAQAELRIARKSKNLPLIIKLINNALAAIEAATKEGK